MSRDRGDEDLRRELERLAAIRSDVIPGAFMARPGARRKSAGEKSLEDNQRSGRLLWRSAGRSARVGLEALAGGDVRMAGIFLRQAQSAEREAYRQRLGAAGLEDLSTSAKARGRQADPATAERDRRFAAAVEIQEARGLTGTAAITAAWRADPELYEAFRDMKPDGVALALARGRRSG